jgi:hypothetical protein
MSGVGKIPPRTTGRACPLCLGTSDAICLAIASKSSPRGGLTRRYRATEIGSPRSDSTRVVAHNMRAAGKQMVTVVPTST